METILPLAGVLVIAALVFFVVLYVWPGLRGTDEERGEVGEPGRFVVRTYRGRQQGDVVATYVADAEALGASGYEPIGQSWGDGQWDGASFLFALILCLFGIGLLLLAYMAIIRPNGTLVVTYRRVSGGTGPAGAPAGLPT
jgi:hypothetical protein